MLDGGPSRVPQPNDRRAAYRQQAPVRQQPESPRPTPEPQPMLASPPAVDAKRSQPNWLKSAIIPVVLLLALAVAGWLTWSSLRSDGAAMVENDRYQAVFLAGGQIYFGKLDFVSADYMRLTEVFYVQSGANQPAGDEAEAAEGSDLQLIKLGEEVHAPEDEMFINRDQVLFFENLKQDGQVVELIENYRSGQN